MDANDEHSPLTLDQLVSWAEERTHLLYEGTEVAHRSCGIALAETFGRRTEPYQALRKGGLTGCGECGAIKAGELILGEVFGDPDPTGKATPTLIEAAKTYRELWQTRVDTGSADTIICNDLAGQFTDFWSAERHTFCTRLASTVAACVAQTILEMGGSVVPSPAPER